MKAGMSAQTSEVPEKPLEEGEKGFWEGGGAAVAWHSLLVLAGGTRMTFFPAPSVKLRGFL